METIGLKGMTLTISINEDSLAAIERQLDALECLRRTMGARSCWCTAHRAAMANRMISGEAVSRAFTVVNHPTSQEHMMRLLNISRPGVATDDEFCPPCHVLVGTGVAIKRTACVTMIPPTDAPGTHWRSTALTRGHHRYGRQRSRSRRPDGWGPVTSGPIVTPKPRSARARVFALSLGWTCE